MSFIKRLKDLRNDHSGIAGGKGASLGEMISAGIPVPEGFVVLSSAFEYFLEKCGIKEKIDEILKSDDFSNEEKSKHIKHLILNSKIPKEIEKEIIFEFGKMGATFVAVRSSATAEDSKTDAWAGQLESYLNTQKKDLIKNVLHCYASLFSPRAIFYRIEKGLSDKKISVAVVVQKMIQSEVSGIAFSAHPVTNNLGQIMIEAGYGLGEAIVSGQITPDNYVIDKKKNKVISKNINLQKRKLVRTKNGNEWKEVTSGEHQKLSDSHILELAKLVMKIEDHYYQPMDIEWALFKKRFYIVQARPITTIRREENNKTKDETLVQKFKKEIRNEEIFVLRGHFIPLFLVTDWLRFYDEKFEHKKGIYPVLLVKHNGLLMHYLSLKRYLETSRDGIQRYIDNKSFKKRINSRYEKEKKIINKLYQKYFTRERHTEKNLLNTLKEAEKNLHEIVAITLFIDFLDEKTLTRAYTENGLNFDFRKIFEIANICDFASFDLKNNLEILKWKNKNTEYLKFVYSGYSVAPTKEEVRYKLSKIDLRKLRIEVNKAEKEIARKIREKRNLRDKLNAKEKNVVDFISWISQMRDDRKNLMNKIDVLMNETVQALYDVWGLDKQLSFNSYAFEVLKGKKFVLENIDRVKSRSGDFVNIYYGNEKYVERYDDLKEEFKEAELLEESKNDQKNVTGQAANKGEAKGYVRIILDLKKIHSFMEGEILVTSMTRPEFVPMMKKASAIVTDEGGITCHAAIISRELKIPCIIGTKIATQVLKDGDYVEVDANKGIVKILEKDPDVHVDSQLSLNITPVEWEKYWQANVSYLMCSLLGQSYAQYIPSTGSRGFSKVYIFSHNGNSSCYFRLADRREYSRHVISRYAANINSISKLSTFIKNNADKLISYIHSIKTKMSKKQYIEFKQMFFEYNSYHIMPRHIADHMNDSMPKIFIDTLKKARIYVETLHSEIDKFLARQVLMIIDDTDCIPEVALLSTSLEIEEYYKTGKFPSIKELLLRKNSAGYVFTKDDILVLDSVQTAEVEKKFMIVPSLSEIKGNTAYPGIAKGTARIVLDPVHYNAFGNGDILITGMTRPEFVSIMKKASAVVTDAGGLLCHAAIISRELKKPCIIGTKIATQVLKDGDYVEVDANKGIVKILKRA